MLELINHELVHSITADVIGFDDIPSKLTDEHNQSYEDIKKSLLELRMTKYDKFSELFDDRLDYAVNSNFPHELVSIFSSEVEMRRELQLLDLNLFNKVNDTIKTTVRIKTDERSQTTHSSRNTRNGQERSNRHVLSTDTTRAGSSQSISQTDTTSQNNARDTTTTQGDIFDAKSQTNEPNIESTDKNGYETNLIKRIGSNAWVVTGFKKPKDGYGQGHGKTIPTEHQSYSARTDVGASDKVSDDDMAKSKDLTIPTHIKPTLHRQDVGASDKSKDLVANMVATDFANDELTSNRSHKVSTDSLIQDTQEFNQPKYSTVFNPT